MDKAAVVAALREIAALLALEGASKFKVRAFEKGASSLEATPQSLPQLVTEKRLLELPGIGAALAHQIQELHDTGSSALLDSLRTGLPSGVIELSQVGGIGLHALKMLHEEHGIATLDDLKAAIDEGRLQTVRGFGDKRAAKIRKAIERYETVPPAIALAEGLDKADSLAAELSELPDVLSAHLAGTVRRFHEVSTELAFVLETDAPDAVLERLGSLPRVGSVLEEQPGERLLRLADGTRVRVVTASPDALGAVLVHRTATDLHWAKLAERAEEKGLSLGTRGLTRNGASVVTHAESDLYARLALSAVPPELREDVGEVEEAALEPHRAIDLVEASDIQGFVHCHTTWSDGNADIETMARAAEARGARFITITDHSPAAHYAGGLDIERLKRQWDEIAEVQERVKIRILRGSEVDILADGALDLPLAILEQLDVVIASIHARHRQDEAAMTDRVLRAMRHPLFKIWGHPLGRLVTSRPPIPLRMEEVLDAIAESNAAIEISGDPARLDLEPRWARAARQRGIRFVLGVDAHSVRGFDYLRYAVGLARRAGLRKGDVLNALPADAFVNAVRPRARAAA
ncbi:MAG: hypothetical protein JWP97_396 [Labilithrix sp.]|nr:hypothetical protein [Labilithrix sp.]